MKGSTLNSHVPKKSSLMNGIKTVNFFKSGCSSLKAANLKPPVTWAPPAMFTGLIKGFKGFTSRHEWRSGMGHVSICTGHVTLLLTPIMGMDALILFHSFRRKCC